VTERGDRVSSGFSRTLIERSGYQSEDFAALYDRYRLIPPPELLDILSLYAMAERPPLVIDLGAGTGLSTRVWADRAERAVGAEPNRLMVEQARRVMAESNVDYVAAYGAETGLAGGEADIVTCAQAFHWMEPEPALAEAARLLRPGGVFAAYDYDVPPVIEPEVDAAFAAHFAARGRAQKRLNLDAGAASWPKEGHLERIRQSGHFRFAREIVCHGFGEADADWIVGLAESLGGPRSIFGKEAPEVGETFETLRQTAERIVGDQSRPMVVCYRIRVGVKWTRLQLELRRSGPA
jgi:SAM-dependent methyltransferase